MKKANARTPTLNIFIGGIFQIFPLVGATSLIIGEHIMLESILELVREPLIAGIGAFAGGMGAFLLQRRYQDRAAYLEKAKEGRKAQMLLFEIWNDQVQYKREVLDRVERNIEGGGWFEMQGHVAVNRDVLNVDIGDLEFLLDYSDKNLMPALIIEVKRYKLVMGLIEFRSNIWLNEIRPRLSEAGVATGELFDFDRLEEILGPDIYHKARDTSLDIATFINQNVGSVWNVLERVTASMDELASDIKDRFNEEIYVPRFTDREVVEDNERTEQA